MNPIARPGARISERYREIESRGQMGKSDILIRMIPLETIQPYERNSRTHSDAQIEQIIASINEFGWTNPILIDEDKNIIAGEGRYRAASKMGLTAAPCIELVGLTEAQKRAYVIADNKLALNAGWDEKLLSMEIGSLQDFDFNLSLTGFDRDELDAILSNTTDAQGLTDQDEVPPIPETPSCLPGDIWILGNHRLLCGDSTKPEHVARLMEQQMADMVFTDPPYNVNYSGRGKKTSTKIENDNQGSDQFTAFLKDVFANYAKHTKVGAGLYIFHASRTQANFEAALETNGYEVKAQIIWNKPMAALGWGDYRWKHEPMFYAGCKGGKTQFYGDRKNKTVWDFQKSEMELLNWAKRQKKLETEGKTTIWSMKREPTGDYVHPTQKPVELITYAIHNSSKAGDIILDLFGGSGATMIASERTKRICRMMELDPRYCDVIIERWQNFTGQQAVAADSGQPYHEIKTERTKPN